MSNEEKGLPAAKGKKNKMSNDEKKLPVTKGKENKMSNVEKELPANQGKEDKVSDGRKKLPANKNKENNKSSKEKGLSANKSKGVKTANEEKESVGNKSKENKKKRKADVFVIGTLARHKRGFGFVIPQDQEGGDIFIPERKLNGAMNGDVVEVKLLPPWEWDRSKEGAIVKVLERSVKEVVGTFQERNTFGFVVPNDRRIADRIVIAKEEFHGAEQGDKVVAFLPQGEERLIFHGEIEGSIGEIISKKDEPGGDIKAMIRQYGLTKEFPPRVRDAAENANQDIPAAEIARRKDLRDRMIITIDGADAKDLDDAVSISALENGNYLLGVHIADVSHYVKEVGALDKEALKRGCSVYLIDQVIPMLPKELSNGICSLHPQVDRLTLSITMEVNEKGKVIHHEIEETVIRSKERMVYTDVSDLLEKQDPELKKKYGHIYGDLLLMERLAVILRTARMEQGSLDFDFDEAYITLNEQGDPSSVEIAERRIGNRMIEEFMLLANQTVAEHFYWMEIPFVYRVHETPSLEKMEEFRQLIKGFGLMLKGNLENVHPKALNAILLQVEGKSEEHVVNTVMLRSMKKAFYSIDCEGHFGLGMKYYCHFTSPIRRYPDLIIHRIIKEVCTSGLETKRLSGYKRKMEKAAFQSSVTERQAQELEREVEKMKKTEYMSYHIGEVYEGIISSVTSFGFFVQLKNTIEGLVKIETLQDDYYDYEPFQHRLIGQRTNRIYTLGDPITITVDHVNLPDRETYFSVGDGTEQKPKKEVFTERREGPRKAKKGRRTGK